MTSIGEAGTAFEFQAGFCEQLGSPFTARVLNILATDIADGGPVALLLETFEAEPIAAALALRVTGAFHRRALNEPTSALGVAYQFVDGKVADGLDDASLRSLLIADLVENKSHYERYLESPPQTNEVGRSAVMIGGYLAIAGETNLPLHVFEIGASAGLNLGCDQFAYELGKNSWGPTSSPVSLRPDWRGGSPPVGAHLTIVERAGCDIAPVDIHDVDACRRLESYLWPDQPERLARLRGAIAIAKELGTKVKQQSADGFVKEMLARPAPNGVRVIAHTIMWQYMPEDMRASIEQTIAKAGDAAEQDAPIAWLRLEPDDVKGLPVLRLNLWPGGETRDLAIAHPHGASVKWL